jgi:hypothetical protein
MVSDKLLNWCVWDNEPVEGDYPQFTAISRTACAVMDLNRQLDAIRAACYQNS